MLLIYPIFTIFFIVILNPERARSDTEQNFFISAEEAKTYGIIDRVVDKLPSFSQP
ncbi:MAG: ATP-dependent Clp protease proteolytic subunit [Oscillatoriaceae cyanobacterium Prado104]|nr:ATP-dependent Clp protease proteolytic subunit [Oscillatoriaceae cyanobacterium Prado104]